MSTDDRLVAGGSPVDIRLISDEVIEKTLFELWHDPVVRKITLYLRLKEEMDQRNKRLVREWLAPDAMLGGEAPPHAEPDSERGESDDAKFTPDHRDAWDLANMRRVTSNLARCYLELRQAAKDAVAFVDPGQDPRNPVHKLRIMTDG